MEEDGLLARVTRNVSATDEFVPRHIKWVEHQVTQDFFSSISRQARGPGLFRVNVADDASAERPQDAPVPTRYVTEPAILGAILSKPLAHGAVTAGLENKGVTCYVNAMLQALYHTKAFGKLFTDARYRVLMSSSQVCRAFLDSFDLLRKSRSAKYPLALIKQLSAFGMSPHKMGDAYELLLLLLERLADAEIRATNTADLRGVNKETTAIDQLLATLVRGSTTCTRCGLTSHTYVQNRSLQLPLQSSLVKSLCGYLKPVTIDGYTCERCGAGAVIEKSTEICKPFPRVLVVSLSRWDFTGKKVSSPCRVPLYLNMADMQTFGDASDLLRRQKEAAKTSAKAPAQGTLTAQLGRAILQDLQAQGPAGDGDASGNTHGLTAVICHQGLQLHSGHYTCFVKDPQSQVWRQYDDESVVTIKAAEVRAGDDAYCLIYESLRITPAGYMCGPTEKNFEAVQLVSAAPPVGPRDAPASTETPVQTRAPAPDDFQLFDDREFSEQSAHKTADPNGPDADKHSPEPTQKAVDGIVFCSADFRHDTASSKEEPPALAHTPASTRQHNRFSGPAAVQDDEGKLKEHPDKRKGTLLARAKAFSFSSAIKSWTHESGVALGNLLSGALADGGELSLVSPLLHAKVSDMDAEIDRGRKRKTQKDRDENYRRRHEDIRERKHKRHAQYQKKQDRSGNKFSGEWKCSDSRKSVAKK